MSKNTFIPILFILALAAIGYAVYRSTAIRITTVDANNQQSVYGEPQNGLILGLCLFAGICLFCITKLIDHHRRVSRDEDRSELSRRTLS